MVGIEFQENNKSLVSSVLISKTDTRRSLANEPQVHDGCFVLEEETFLDPTNWLTCSSMAKLMADLNHHLGTKTHLGSLRHAGDSSRVKGLMMSNVLPGGRKY